MLQQTSTVAVPQYYSFHSGNAPTQSNPLTIPIHISPLLDHQWTVVMIIVFNSAFLCHCIRWNNILEHIEKATVRCPALSGKTICMTDGWGNHVVAPPPHRRLCVWLWQHSLTVCYSIIFPYWELGWLGLWIFFLLTNSPMRTQNECVLWNDWMKIWFREVSSLGNGGFLGRWWNLNPTLLGTQV